MKISRLIKSITVLVMIFLVANGFAQEVKIDLSKEYQTIRGFGGMNHTTWIRDLNEDNREKAFGNDPGEIGLSILRVHIDPEQSRFNLELPTAQHAISKGAIVFGTPWNAPSALLDPANTSRVNPAKYGEYVSHLNAFNKYMSDNGTPLYAVSVQNEPDYGEWTRWTSEEMLNFVRDYAQDIENKVMAPESFQFRRVYTDPILNDAQAADNVDIIGGHIYGGGLFDYPLARDKGKDVWMTEHLTGSDAPELNNWSLAMEFGKEINDCMKANFNAYIWWYIRRFYGLIADDGNISDKGYVISQYAKFIRPGAVRVDASTTSTSMIDVTAYKNDTTMVFVVVNRNNKSVELDFSITNGNADKITQFTTSATKKVVNDGEIAVSGGTFTATVDAKSVTTFTSSVVNGGKQGNVKPTANAGDDLILDDAEGTGSAVIKLDGSLSSDSDGEIVNYSWSMNGQQISWNAIANQTITIGEYELVLTVTDNDGATDTDTLEVKLSSTKDTEIWFEAECGAYGLNWQKLPDAGASKGVYVEALSGVQSLASGSTNGVDLLVYNFETTETGSYKIWGRVITPTANDDSYWVKVDDTEWIMWNSIPAGTSWHWDDVHNQSNDNPVIYDLVPGLHTLLICMREDGAKLDKILISNTGITPADSGEEATNCIPDDPEAAEQIDINNSAISVYPNPSGGNVNIVWKSGFDMLQVHNVTGQLVYNEKFTSEIHEAKVNFNLESGIYFVILKGDKTSGVSKIIIE